METDSSRQMSLESKLAELSRELLPSGQRDKVSEEVDVEEFAEIYRYSNPKHILCRNFETGEGEVEFTTIGVDADGGETAYLTMIDNHTETLMETRVADKSGGTPDSIVDVGVRDVESDMDELAVTALQQLRDLGWVESEVENPDLFLNEDETASARKVDLPRLLETRNVGVGLVERMHPEVSVSGKPGSGSGELARNLSEKTDVELVSSTDRYREKAREEDKNLMEAMVDHARDSRQGMRFQEDIRYFSDREGRGIYEGLDVADLVEGSDLDVKLVAADDARYERFSEGEDVSREGFEELDRELEEVQERWLGVDHDSTEEYDLVLNTSNSSIDEVAEFVMDRLREEAVSRKEPRERMTEVEEMVAATPVEEMDYVIEDLSELKEALTENRDNIHREREFALHSYSYSINHVDSCREEARQVLEEGRQMEDEESSTKDYGATIGM